MGCRKIPGLGVSAGPGDRNSMFFLREIADSRFQKLNREQAWWNADLSDLLMYRFELKCGAFGSSCPSVY
jgi:hypothetical protein